MQNKVITGADWSHHLNAHLRQKKYSDVFILCDENTLQCCLPLLITSCPALAEAQIIETESGEHNKSLDIAAGIWQTLTESQADRNTLLINLGGGVISDLGGFCASVYKRGIDFINVPTSLIGMADASTGGKNGINYNGLKNIIGTINPPVGIYINTDFLSTLPERHLKNGMAEIYKMALISDIKLWERLKKPVSTSELSPIIARSVLLKQRIVKLDPLDKGPRQVLNFGHTIGHAIESLAESSDKGLLHGEAVVAGMLIETAIARNKKLISAAEQIEINRTLLFAFPDSRTISFNEEEIYYRMLNDKKTKNGKIKMALIDSIGSCVFDQPVTREQIQKAILQLNTVNES